jgi:hypothetical protein
MYRRCKYMLGRGMQKAELDRQSIWTTQKENGKTFNTAFLTCKNVVFVFSVNHSRAFQGYVRATTGTW